jgi:putative tryptophan/tyrosine transport system substrate-binding protein
MLPRNWLGQQMQFDRLKRREFITLVGGAVAWPLAARAQQPQLPVIGSMHAASQAGTEDFMTAFRQGLKETGYVEGQNVLIEYRWANGSYDRQSSLMKELIDLRVNIIVTWGPTAIRTAKMVQATGVGTAIPIVFAAGTDPVADGIVASLNRPGGNITGVTSIAAALAPKRLQFLRELVPNVESIGLLTNSDDSAAVNERRDAEVAASALGWRLHTVVAKNERELDTAFETLAQKDTSVLVVISDTFFLSRLDRIAALATRYRLPTIAPYREFTTRGGLMSYGTSIPDVFRQTGVYTGRVLRGAKPADLPILQPTKFEFVINLNTAKTLGLTAPPGLLAIADEVIE